MGSEYVPNRNESMHMNEPVFGGRYEGLFGKHVAIPQYNDESLLRSVRLATAGGVLRSIDGKYFVTAGHAFDVGTPDSSRIYIDIVNFNFEIDESSDSEGNLPMQITEEVLLQSWVKSKVRVAPLHLLTLLKIAHNSLENLFLEKA
jgi:hypothetical protein